MGVWTAPYGSTEGATYRCSVIQLPGSSRISQLADSFFHLFILLLLCSVGMWIVIPFAQGAAEIEFLLNEGKEVSSQYTLKAILQKMKPDEVWIWRKHYIFISIMYLAAWFAVMLIDSGILC